MDQKAQSSAANNRVYEDFEPFFEWTEDEESATLVVMLPGFRKEQFRVQVTSTPIVRINGERHVIEKTWGRFGKEFAIPSYCDTNDAIAKFERGVLSVKFPKLITPTKPQEQEAITNPPEEKEAPMPQKEAISDEKEKKKIEEQVGDQGGKQQANKMIQRLKTRLLDFNISFRSGDDIKDVNQGFCGGGDTRPNRWKILMNMIVAIFLILVFGVYLKNALWSSSSSSYKGESNFQEF